MTTDLIPFLIAFYVVLALISSLGKDPIIDFVIIFIILTLDMDTLPPHPSYPQTYPCPKIPSKTTLANLRLIKIDIVTRPIRQMGSIKSNPTIPNRST
jgi:hypothetical protein